MTEEEIERALWEACVESGFCSNTLTGKNLLEKYNGKLTAADFATSVIYAEGMEPRYSMHRPFLESVFRKYVASVE